MTVLDTSFIGINTTSKFLNRESCSHSDQLTKHGYTMLRLILAQFKLYHLIIFSTTNPKVALVGEFEEIAVIIYKINMYFQIIQKIVIRYL